MPTQKFKAGEARTRLLARVGGRTRHLGLSPAQRKAQAAHMREGIFARYVRDAEALLAKRSEPATPEEIKDTAFTLLWNDRVKNALKGAQVRAARKLAREIEAEAARQAQERAE